MSNDRCSSLSKFVNAHRRLPDFSTIRSVRQIKRSALENLPKSDVQIPTSIILNHHRQKSAFRPIQTRRKSPRASSEGHSSSSSISLNSSDPRTSLKNRRSSFDEFHFAQSIKTIQRADRTISEILCDQFSELNVEEIEKDSLRQPTKLQIQEKQEKLRIFREIARNAFLIGKIDLSEMNPSRSKKSSSSSTIDRFLETRGLRETII